METRSDEAGCPPTGPLAGSSALRFKALDERRAAIYRAWTPAQKLKAVDDMMRFMRSLVTGVVAGEHPEWSEEEIRCEVARRILGNPAG